ncbi:aldolase [Jeotgalibacillus malaysiensis]|uniref:aldolase n=1 Tax=Jeotgalibacillus malaysiensis TaxID=1508404 RepID=UPI00384B8657
MNTLYDYKAFGLGIKSDVELSELKLATTKCDVSITRSDRLSLEWKTESNENTKSFARDGHIMFEVNDIGWFKITGGHTIQYQSTESAELRQIKLYLLGSCMGAILLQRKVLPLHGSAVLINGKAYAIVGDSGAGKSTLARALMEKGYKLISDDILATRFKEGVPYLSSSYAQQKLWVESLDMFSMDADDYESIMLRETKFNVPVKRFYFNGEVELAGVFELSKADLSQPLVKNVQGIERLPLLFHHTYRKSFINRIGLTDWHFNTTARLAGQVDVYKITRPENQSTAHELADMIISIANKEDLQYAKAE